MWKGADVEANYEKQACQFPSIITDDVVLMEQCFSVVEENMTQQLLERQLDIINLVSDMRLKIIASISD